MPLKAKISSALLICAALTACQGSGGSGSSNGSGSPAPTSGASAPVGLQQCQAVTTSPASTAVPATPAAPPASGTIQASLVLVAEGTHSLGVYLRNPWTGALVDRGYVPTGGGPSAVAVSAGQYVYVANSQDGTISAYQWQPAQAQLSPLGQAVASGPHVSSLAVVGNTLYALNSGNNTISIFQIGSGGALTVMPAINSPALISLAAGTNGSLYGVGSNEIVSYSATANGGLTNVGTTSLSGIIGGVSGSGNLYVLTTSTVTAFHPNGSGGLDNQDSVALPSGLAPTAITAGPTQVSVAGDSSNNTTELANFPLVSGGITCATSAVLGASGQTGSAAFSPGGHFIYVSNNTRGDLLAYTASTSGSGPELIADVRTRTAPGYLTSLTATVTVSPQALYVVNQSSDQIAGYAVAANGALGATPFTDPTTCNSCTTNLADQGPSVITMAPNGQNLYASDWAEAGQGDVTGFGVSNVGVLGAPASSAAGQSPMGIAVDPSNRYLYVANSCYENTGGGNCPGTIDGFGLTHGAIASAPSTTVGTGLYPMLLTVDPTGQYLYVAQYAANSIGAFTINPDTGALSSTGSAPAGTNPWTVIVGPSGRHLYASDNGSGVSLYRINGATGALTPASTPTLPVAGNPLGLAIGPKGRRLYVATQSGTVEVFDRTQPIGGTWNPTPLVLGTTFTNAYGLGIANNAKALYVVDNCTQTTNTSTSYKNGSVQALAIPAFSASQNAANYQLLGSAQTGQCSVEAVPGGGLG